MRCREKNKTKKNLFSSKESVQLPKVPAQFNSRVVGPVRYITGCLKSKIFTALALPFIIVYYDLFI